MDLLFKIFSFLFMRQDPEGVRRLDYEAITKRWEELSDSMTNRYQEAMVRLAQTEDRMSQAEDRADDEIRMVREKWAACEKEHEHTKLILARMEVKLESLEKSARRRKRSDP